MRPVCSNGCRHRVHGPFSDLHNRSVSNLRRDVNHLEKGVNLNATKLVVLEDRLTFLGCYGQKHIHTPCIDRLAEEGMRFTQAYAGCTVCAPSRCCLMTGLHSGHISVRGNGGGVALQEKDVTVAELLRQDGYATGLFGKWGLGDEGTPGVPDRMGFDEFFGYLHQLHAQAKSFKRNTEPPHLKSIFRPKRPGGCTSPRSE